MWHTVCSVVYAKFCIVGNDPEVFSAPSRCSVQCLTFFHTTILGSTSFTSGRLSLHLNLRMFPPPLFSPTCCIYRPRATYPTLFLFKKKNKKKTPCAVRTCWAKFTSQQSQARVGPTGCVRVINHDSHLPSCDYQLLNLCERPRDGNSHMAGKSEAGMLFECKLQQDLCPEWRCVWRILLCFFFFFYLYV